MEFDVGRLGPEDDPGRPHPAAVVALEHSDPEAAVEKNGEDGWHSCLQVRRSGPGDAGFSTSGTTEATSAPRGAARTSHRAVRFAHQELTVPG